ncbi:AraC family transcriptional regulator [Aquimarina sp. 2201CG1-2-11]|uniref:helix-turn-helix domain-containing protein n=1 Tax=Aquimarina discodermiae TaxID=3231043 RepID=UPI003462BFC8
MDKKRREKNLSKTEGGSKKNTCALYSIIQPTITSEQCGIVSKHFTFLEQYGTGYYHFYHFDGLSIGIYDVLFTEDIILEGELSEGILELSFLIEGEQIIKIEGVDTDLVYESQESYLVYLSETKGSIAYYKNKPLKQVKIRMDISFIQKHCLNQEYNILHQYYFKKLKRDFAQPLCNKTREIVAEILTDDRKGLLKRLFLESKTLELISLMLDSQSTNKSEIANSVDNVVKKLYQTQHLIASDLSVQYSIQQLARQTGLNDFTLKKQFKRVFGKTIFEYASELRMEKAKQLLLHSKKPIYEISELIGYKNSTHFTAAFKKIEGITPKKYRNSITKVVEG